MNEIFSEEIIQKFSIKRVISNSFEIYQNNFKAFFMLSFFFFLVGQVVYFARKAVIYISIHYSGFSIISNKVLMVVIILSVYFMIKIMIATQLAIIKSINNENVSIGECYVDASSSVWKVMKASILVTLALLIPVLLSVLAFSDLMQMKLRIVIGGLGIILLIYLIVKYTFITLIRVVKPDEKKYFKYAKRLIKGNFPKVALVVALS